MMFRSIAITGASGGIGAALAEHCAAPGIVLHLAGRDAARLESVALKCRARGAEVQASTFDVTDADATRGWIDAADHRAPIDLVIANAGLSSSLGPNATPEDFAQLQRVIAVNFGGAVNVIEPAVARMLPRRRGRIAVIGSLAGLHGLPACPSYSASKAAIHTYGQALRGWLKPCGIGVTVICPGYVETPMSDRVIGSKPFLVSAPKAARIILDGIARDRAIVVFPRLLGFGIRMLPFLPEPLALFALKLFHFSVLPAE